MDSRWILLFFSCLPHDICILCVCVCVKCLSGNELLELVCVCLRGTAGQLVRDRNGLKTEKERKRVEGEEIRKDGKTEKRTKRKSEYGMKEVKMQIKGEKQGGDIKEGQRKEGRRVERHQREEQDD